MMITRESDYAVRIIRALRGGGLMTIQQICERECIPKQFAYKILKKLDLAGLVQIKRGAGGGCALARDLSLITLYDVIRATDEEFFLTHCLQGNFDCEYLAKSPCTIHRELARVQGVLERELQSRTMAELLGMNCP
ncbi:MAG: Rrf2 family transcriptional regulator [Clostridium sp.]|nr:Rrf2 family transcriptional regulator [Clostridium sp.]